MVPFYGQGMNCGFEDVLVFDEIITKHLGDTKTPSTSVMESILTEYSTVRSKVLSFLIQDAEAMCDLAYHNYIEMRSHVTSASYLFRKSVESFIYKTTGRCMPLYSMVSFSRIRYSEALERFESQTKVWETTGAIAKWVGIAGFLVGLGLARKKLYS